MNRFSAIDVAGSCVVTAFIFTVWLTFITPPLTAPLSPVSPRAELPGRGADGEHVHLGKCPTCDKAFDQGLDRKVKRMVDEQMRSRFNVLGVGSKLPGITRKGKK